MKRNWDCNWEIHYKVLRNSLQSPQGLKMEEEKTVRKEGESFSSLGSHSTRDNFVVNFAIGILFIIFFIDLSSSALFSTRHDLPKMCN